MIIVIDIILSPYNVEDVNYRHFFFNVNVFIVLLVAKVFVHNIYPTVPDIVRPPVCS